MTNIHTRKTCPTKGIYFNFKQNLNTRIWRDFQKRLSFQTTGKCNNALVCLKQFKGKKQEQKYKTNTFIACLFNFFNWSVFIIPTFQTVTWMARLSAVWRQTAWSCPAKMADSIPLNAVLKNSKRISYYNSARHSRYGRASLGSGW